MGRNENENINSIITSTPLRPTKNEDFPCPPWANTTGHALCMGAMSMWGTLTCCPTSLCIAESWQAWHQLMGIHRRLNTMGWLNVAPLQFKEGPLVTLPVFHVEWSGSEEYVPCHLKAEALQIPWTAAVLGIGCCQESAVQPGRGSRVPLVLLLNRTFLQIYGL